MRITFYTKKWGIIWGTRNKKRPAETLQGVLSGADDTAFDEKITYHSESQIS